MWTVPDIDAAVARVREAGGTVLAQPSRQPYGVTAECSTTRARSSISPSSESARSRSLHAVARGRKERLGDGQEPGRVRGEHHVTRGQHL